MIGAGLSLTPMREKRRRRMRIEKLTNGQKPLCAMLGYDINDRRKIIAFEITGQDLLDYNDPSGEASVFGVMIGRGYYLLTLKKGIIETIERVSKETALKYALA